MAQNLNLGSLNLSIGANTDALTAAVVELKKVSTAVRSLGTRVSNNTKKIEESFTKQATAIKKTTSAQTKATKAAMDAEKALRREDKALSSTVIKTNNLKAAIERAGASQRDINIVNQAMARFRKNIRGAGNDSARFAKEQALLSRRLSGVRTRLTRFNSELRKKQMAEAARQAATFQTKMQDLTKSIQLALGPLSGVASRVTAFTGLVNKNTLAIAGFIGVIIALGVTLIKAVKAGVQFESQLRQIEAQLGSSRKDFELTAKQVNKLAEEVADATLTSAKLARAASSTLLTFSRVTATNFARVLRVSQDVVTVIGGDLVTAARRVARAMQDPTTGIDALNRQLAVLTPEEIKVAKGLAEIGKEAKAAEFILQKLEDRVGGLADAAATGLAGAFDTTLERIGRFLEIAASAGGILQPITDVLNTFSSRLDRMNRGLDQNSIGLRIASRGMQIFAKILETIINNFDVFAGTLTIVAGGFLLRKFAQGLIAIRAAMIGVNVQLAVMNALAKVNPFLLFAGAVASVLILLKTFKKEADIAGLSVEDLQTRINKAILSIVRIAKDRTLTDITKEIAVRPLKKEIEDLSKAMILLQGDLKKVGAEDLTGILDARLQIKFRELNNELVLSELTPTGKKLADFAKQFGKVELSVDKAGLAVFEFLGEGTPAQEDFRKELERLRAAFEQVADFAFLAAQRNALLTSALSNVQLVKGAERATDLANAEQQLAAVQLELQKPFEQRRASTLKLLEASDQLKEKIKELRSELTSVARSLSDKRFEEAIEITDATTDAYGRSIGAIRQFKKDQIKLNIALRDNRISQSTFNQSLVQMQREIALNTRGVQEFANITSRGFAKLVTQGGKVKDILGQIGEALAEAAFQALIFEAIIRGAGLLGTPNGGGQITGGETGSTGGSAGPTGTGSLSSSTLTGVQAPAPTTQLVGTAGPGDGVIIQIDAKGADPGTEARIERAIRDMGDDSVRRSVRAVRESRLRG